jgi:hypothetical protein
VTLDVYASLSFMAEITEATRRILEAHSPWLRIRAQDFSGDAMWKRYISMTPEQRKLVMTWELENRVDTNLNGIGTELKNVTAASGKGSWSGSSRHQHLSASARAFPRRRL